MGFSWASTMQTQITQNGNYFEMTGQIVYSWQIQSANVEFVSLEAHWWAARALVDPSFTGSVTPSVSVSGFWDTSTNAKFRGDWMMGGSLDAGGSNNWGTDFYDTTPGWSTPPFGPPTGPYVNGGNQHLFNYTASGAPISFAAGHAGEANINNFMFPYMEVRPISGQYFAQGSTVSLIFDLPAGVGAEPVPEPATLIALAGGLGAMLRRRKRVS